MTLDSQAMGVMMTIRRCPLCHSKLTEEHYHKVLGIDAERKKAERQLRAQLAEAKKARRQQLHELRQQQAAMRRELSSEKIRLRQETRRMVADARRESKRNLDAKVRQAVARAGKQIEKLKHENDRLRRGQSLGDAGLQTENDIYNILRHYFREDDVKHTGKGGDVLHTVMRRKKPVGTIVYEIKDTQRLQASHITQTSDAIRARKADFGVLVTNGARHNFTGFHIERDVIVVRPGGLLAAAEFLRNHLVQVNEAYLRATQKNVAGKRLLEYMSSRDFRTHMSAYIEVHRTLHDQLNREMKTHLMQWKERDTMHRRLFITTHVLQGSVDNLLVGKQPLKAAVTTPPILTLPRTVP